MLRISLLNPKGGCGKTTLATNLAGYYALRGLETALVDHDPQASSVRWLSLRAEEAPPIYGVAAYERSAHLTRSFQLRVPPETEVVIVDIAAGVNGQTLRDHVIKSDVILIPVLPSPIDMHATADFIKHLFLVGKARQHGVRIGVVANRVRENTLVFRDLQRFLTSLGLPFLTSLRDSQNYIRAAQLGLGIHELEASRTHQDRLQWSPLLAWLDNPDESGTVGTSSAQPAPASSAATDTESDEADDTPLNPEGRPVP